MLRKPLFAAAGLAFLALPHALRAVVNLEISGAQTEIFGTSTEVTGSGSPDNFDANTSTGDFAVFDIVQPDDNGPDQDFADLAVTYAADNGSAGADIMIARTVDSQGLVDEKTISILTSIGDAAGGTVDLTFEWFEPGSFDTLADGQKPSNSKLLQTPVNYTTLDIDFEQLVRVQRSDLQSYTLDNPTDLDAVDDGSTVTFQDSGAESNFNDPVTAAQFLTSDAIAASHTIEVGKQSESGNALFMFEFRDPTQVVNFNDPQTTPVPEPASFAFVLGAAALLHRVLTRRGR